MNPDFSDGKPQERNFYAELVKYYETGTSTVIRLFTLLCYALDKVPKSDLPSVFQRCKVFDSPLGELTKLYYNHIYTSNQLKLNFNNEEEK